MYLVQLSDAPPERHNDVPAVVKPIANYTLPAAWLAAATYSGALIMNMMINNHFGRQEHLGNASWISMEISSSGQQSARPAGDTSIRVRNG